MPADRSTASARCGACRQAIFSERPIEVDEAGFERHVARSDISLLVDVWAFWCGRRRAMVPMFKKAASELEPHVRLLKLNAAKAPVVFSLLEISGIPMLLLMKDGQMIPKTIKRNGYNEHRRLDKSRTEPVLRKFIFRERNAS